MVADESDRAASITLGVAAGAPDGDPATGRADASGANCTPVIPASITVTGVVVENVVTMPAEPWVVVQVAVVVGVEEDNSPRATRLTAPKLMPDAITRSHAYTRIVPRLPPKNGTQSGLGSGFPAS
jgi:hypothetical protein